MATARVVSIHYTLTDDRGAILDSSRDGDPMEYLEGAGNIIPGLEKEVAKMAKGEKKQVKIPAAEAYGERRDDMVLEVPRTQFPPNVTPKVGDRFRGGPEPQAPSFNVIEVKADTVTLDGNHPLAGQNLTFDVELTGVRDATEEEMAHGHVHGPHGHHHH